MIKPSFYCVFIFILLLVLDPCGCFLENPEHELIDPEFAQKIFESMTFEKNDRLNKKEFSEFFFRILTRDMGVKHPHGKFFDSVTKKFCKDLPKEIPIANLSDYIPQDKLYKVIEDVVREEYGEEYVTQLKSTRDMIEKEVDDIDDDDSLRYYDKSTKGSYSSQEL